jgi:ABC-type Fe3+-siderophore transport system permease subunit
MANPASRNFFLLWLFAAFLALAAVAVSYFRSGEANMSALTLALAAIAMSIISRSKNRGPDE